MVKARGLLLMIAAGFFIFTAPGAASAEWSFSGEGINEPHANLVLSDSFSGTIYAATDYFLYMSEDAGKSWRHIFSMASKESNINFINIVSGNQLSILVATDDGLYISSDRGEHWRKAFQKGVNCIASDINNTASVYVATDEGIYVSQDMAKTWQLVSAGLGSVPIKYIIIDKAGKIYISSEGRIFKSEDNGKIWKEIYSFVKKDVLETPPEEIAPEETEQAFTKINSLAANALAPDEIYAAVSKGVLFSKDSGQTWAFMPTVGLGNSEARHIAAAKEKIYIATRSGVFEYNNLDAKWSPIYGGAYFRDVKFLSVDEQNSTIWAASGNGIFKMENTPAAGFNGQTGLPQRFLEKFNNEPSIGDVQRAAIRYAEVHPEKIERWRRLAAKKGLLPKISTNVGNNVSDLWHWEAGSTTKAGDDVLLKGNEAMEWNVGASWDLSEFIWNPDQTNIDVRSRLMVELRDDILDDVTRLYFERRRLQVDMLLSPPRSEKEHCDKLLRIEEITANMDALTGGYFSAKLNNPSENPHRY